MNFCKCCGSPKYKRHGYRICYFCDLMELWPQEVEEQA